MKTRGSAIILIIIIVTGLQCNASKKEDQPNILLLMSDNQYFRHLGAYGDEIVRTPNIDAIALKGVRFTNAFCASPSCTPSRAGLLTGQDIWRLKEGANLWGILPHEFNTYTDLLEENGYAVGFSGKGWGPGKDSVEGRNRNPAGNKFSDFTAFLNSAEKNKPWTFWFSSREPHRPYPVGSGKASSIPVASIKVPPYLPNTDSVRNDIADYYAAIETFDQEVGRIIEALKSAGLYDNTVIVICSDNGWQMPRGLGNLYDFGSHVPLIISYSKWIPARVYDDFVNLNDLAPTFLELAGITVPAAVTAKSLLSLLKADQTEGITDKTRDAVYMGRERHAFVRHNGLGYPMRGIRTNDFLYIHNYEPGRWPSGDPPLYGDVDAHMLHYPSLSKVEVLANKALNDSVYYKLAFAKRPEEELYDLSNDPFQLHNIAGEVQYTEQKKTLRSRLDKYLLDTKDPRATGGKIIWDSSPYYNERDKTPVPSIEYRKRLGLDSVYYLLPTDKKN
ncbi:sulfatase [Terrimonas sp.]|uniref:sulfatase family protein n=1 Tax=Terrimonas sp. TaxID=1914338 RepID=UPI000D50C070|nr:sulfatase [Terrimonas sp.]PVD52836.1 sulfatase [Terrimonas sp.]